MMRNDRKIADSVLDLVGDTPMVRLNRLVQAGWAEVLAKVESMNPARRSVVRSCSRYDSGIFCRAAISLLCKGFASPKWCVSSIRARMP